MNKIYIKKKSEKTIFFLSQVELSLKVIKYHRYIHVKGHITLQMRTQHMSSTSMLLVEQPYQVPFPSVKICVSLLHKSENPVYDDS